jgi:predicted ArsR family transcriptional regulator
MEADTEQPSTESAALAAGLIKALDHPFRRSVLRLLLESGPATAVEAREAITRYTARTVINFHLDILVSTGAIAQSTPLGRRGRVYACTEATQSDWFQTALRLTAAED